jgi:transposase-like protein
VASKLSNVEEEAIAAYRSGCSYEEIAGRFGCSRMTLWRLLKRLGEPCRPDRWDRIAALATEIVAFYKAGHSIAETTERFGCDFRSVHRILRGHEIPKNPLSSRKHSLSQEVARRYRDGESAELLAKVYGVSASTIVRWIRAVKGEIRTTSQSWEFRPPFPRLYRLKEDVFETITEESAYWIGFLMADGNARHTFGNSPPS